MSHYEGACQAASFQPPPPEVLRLRAALRRNQGLIDRFYGVGRGLVPEEEFAGENL